MSAVSTGNHVYGGKLGLQDARLWRGARACVAQLDVRRHTQALRGSGVGTCVGLPKEDGGEIGMAGMEGIKCGRFAW